MSIAIKVENLSKKYIIQHEKKTARYETLSDSLIQSSKHIITKIRHPFSRSTIEQPTQEEFWALKDINFEINQGDKVGIIGRNGAGKSTLLKVLSRITEPTSGKIHINGRIASLLEVGTGFHPELTGAENIYLNGAILGMSRKEIRAKFDEIVDFAEVEQFLDTPVKRYSSGMYVRLAFAVAAHLEPEILIVDEVLAVGDTQFQKKCLGKMEDVSKEGRTVLFVSHNMAIVTALCQKAIWLVNGQISLEGNAEQITSKYLTYGAEHSGEVVLTEPFTNQRFWFKKVSLLNTKGVVSSVFDVREPIKVTLEYEVAQDIKGLDVGFRVVNSSGIPIFTVERSFHLSSDLSKGIYLVEVDIPCLFLVPGCYSINVGSHIPNIEILALHQSLISFEIEETGSHMALYKGLAFGVVLVNFPWKELVINRG